MAIHDVTDPENRTSASRIYDAVCGILSSSSAMLPHALGLLSLWRGTTNSPASLKERAQIPDGSESIEFLQAIRKGNLDRVRAMLQETPALVSLPMPFEGPLHTALNESQDDVAVVLIAAGAKDPEGFLLFYLACQSGLCQTVKMLLDEGTDFPLLTKNARGYTALHATLLQYSETTEAGRLSIAKALIAKEPALVTTEGKERNTPLHLAAISGSHKLVKLFLKKGADVNAVNAHGQTPLLAALEAEDGPNEEVVELLAMSPNILIDQENADQETPLMVATRLELHDIAGFLIQQGANPRRIPMARQLSLNQIFEEMNSSLHLFQDVGG